MGWRPRDVVNSRSPIVSADPQPLEQHRSARVLRRVRNVQRCCESVSLRRAYESHVHNGAVMANIENTASTPFTPKTRQLIVDTPGLLNSALLRERVRSARSAVGLATQSAFCGRYFAPAEH